ncbi:hypothetical protein [Amycolatopsis vancoresmycina]|uniref:Uncharacterized protein n=1 Tax=Amycolatopsis vancoresmycina DSM 44592 TaxID=1292037 RepID=R1I3G0_9PSEU|nr:hypothetical protein [Amycolatopsis vancoresmycina]EOD70345.1 hypothetical protein H480_01477 [Amycolatopsis vancoresmycina DSM 44592]
MTRRTDPRQLGLFGTPTPAPAPVAGRVCPPARGRRKTTGSPSNPLVAKDVLADVRDGKFGLLDDTDRVMVIDPDGHCRFAGEEDIVVHLMSVGYVERSPARETISCLHGVVRKPVLPLRLTHRGRDKLQHWSNLTPFGGTS